MGAAPLCAKWLLGVFDDVPVLDMRSGTAFALLLGGSGERGVTAKISVMATGNHGCEGGGRAAPARGWPTPRGRPGSRRCWCASSATAAAAASRSWPPRVPMGQSRSYAGWSPVSDEHALRWATSMQAWQSCAACDEHSDALALHNNMCRMPPCNGAHLSGLPDKRQPPAQNGCDPD